MRQKVLYSLLLLLVAGVQVVCGQQRQRFSVASFELDPFDQTATNKEYEKIDGSGARYAIIKVTSSNPDDDLLAYRFNFGNLRHEVVQRDGELWVYVQKNAKMVTISREGFVTITRYDLKTTIQDGKTYVMQLLTSAPTVYTQMVEFKVSPPQVGAAVVVKGSGAQAQEEMLGTVDQTGSVAKNLPLGTYTYKVMATDYHTSEGRFVLRDRNVKHEEKVTLRPNFSEVTLQVDAEADIYVNGELKGKQQWTGILKAGNYQVECRQERHRNSSQYITVVDNDSRTFELTRPQPITGTAAVTTRPNGARIEIDGKDYGQTPQNINELLIGRHQVVLTRSNYKTEVREIEIQENQTTEVQVELKDVAQMTIQSHPAGGKLFIDGRQVGTTPYTAEMASGDYQLRIEHNGYQQFEKRVHLDSSQPTVSYDLRRLMLKPTQVSLSAMAQTGTFTGVGGSLGGYVSNVHAEVAYVLGLSKSETIYWSGDDSQGGRQLAVCEYKPAALVARMGYGFIVGTQLRFTPQIGAQLLSVKSEDSTSKCHAVSGLVGVRMEYGLLPHVGVFVAPEVAFAMKKSDIYEQLSAVSSAIKGWGSGFQVSAGVAVNL